MTVALKTNALGAAREGTVAREARMVHGGRTIRSWGAEARHLETDRVIALFRRTQAGRRPGT